MHGGAAPQVQAKAAERLAALVDPAITALSKSLGVEQAAVVLAAAKDILDRAGYKAPEKTEHKGEMVIRWQ